MILKVKLFCSWVESGRTTQDTISKTEPYVQVVADLILLSEGLGRAQRFQVVRVAQIQF